MSFPDDPRIAEAKLIPVQEVLNKLGIYGLTERSGEFFGPCPLCGSEGHDPKSGPCDRFNVNKHSKKFLCRQCGIKGGDQIALVREVTNASFADALSMLCGDLNVDLDPAEAERRRAIAERKAREDQARTNRWRQTRIDDARRFYDRGIDGWRGVVGAYLRARGLPLEEIPTPLKFLLDHPYVKKIGGDNIVLHRGPCMIAPIVDWQTGQVMAIHQTWVDINPPHGKARIVHQCEDYPCKLVCGSKQGNFIPLITPEGADTMVVGEGNETTLSAYLARPDDLKNAAFWCGVDLGNMAGKMLKVEGRRWSGEPDLNPDFDAFLPPPWVKRLIYIEDGDSNPTRTRAMMLCGLKRAQALRPGLRAELVPGVPGFDMNDVLNGKHKKKTEGQNDE
ncbi:DUF7146 domain-containing protein [Phaeobacter gallaeciensis]|uniref:DUF7146 domain-containing protein n=1 Tax=Phaeobacter gallaeciensis TaxID=60890 RepID=UPI0003D69D55|nr:CHC2 zinc finger domain-containing protein [Phaeobacter gallaeciensis]AHD12156.1 DNA primase (bacterial type) [Phaeobacter gallaeciensis DSM 26640]ATE95340.1 DNA primase (bacterial type) [Phaeobacter gallaeciensis]